MGNSAALKLPLKRVPAQPPKELKAPGRALWEGIQQEYAIQDPGGLSHLASACRAADDIARMRNKVSREGDTIKDRFGQIREHPLLAAIRGAEATKRQALKSLNLDIEPLRDKPGRPPGK